MGVKFDDLFGRLRAMLTRPLPGSRNGGAIAPADVEGWLAELTIDRPLACCEKLTARLNGLLSQIESPKARFLTLERISEHLAPVFARLETVPDSQDGSALNIRKTASVAERALDRLARAYADIVHSELETPRGARNAEPEQHVKLAALRACQYSYRRILIVCRSYGDLTPEHWRLPVELYFAAARAQMHDTALDKNNGENIARQLARILLLVLADPHGLSRRGYENARFYIERFGHLARLCGADQWTGDSEGWFLVWPSAEGLRPLLHRGDLDQGGGQRLLLDAHPLLARLDLHREGLATGTSPTRLGLPLNAREPEYVTLLERLREHWGNPPQRAQARHRAQPHADVVIGFEQIRLFMNHAAQLRRATPGETLPKFPVSQWEIFDRSERGMGLERLSEEAVAVEVGEVLAVKPTEEGEVQLAISRRTRFRNSHETELGVELLCRPGLTARFKPTQRDARGHEREPVPFIFLPSVPKLDGAPALLAPPDLVEEGTVIALPHRSGGTIRFESAERVERFASCDLIRLQQTTGDAA
jgi:hypothetical protein